MQTVSVKKTEAYASSPNGGIFFVVVYDSFKFSFVLECGLCWCFYLSGHYNRYNKGDGIIYRRPRCLVFWTCYSPPSAAVTLWRM